MDRVAMKLRRFLEKAHLRVESIARSGGGHYKAIVTNEHEIKRTVILPATPSDHRWERNKLSELRKIFRETPRRQVQNDNHGAA
jgi:hypothetical protein